MSGTDPKQLEQLLRQLLNPQQQQQQQQQQRGHTNGGTINGPGAGSGPPQQHFTTQRFQQNAPVANNLLQLLLSLQQSQNNMRQPAPGITALPQPSTGGGGDSTPQAPSTDNTIHNAVLARSAEGTRASHAGTRMIPCRARRVHVNHNFLNAYFLVPETIQHGDDLLCSFPACRIAGVKFRYCVYCKAPAAKRNFLKRHNHDDDGQDSFDSSSRGGVEDLDGKGESKQTPQRDSLTRLTENRSETQTTAISITDTSSRATQRSSDNGETDRSSLNTVQDKACARKNSSDALSSSSGEMYVPRPKKDPRMQRWVQLLESRPDTMDETGMTVWVEEVMAVSDLKKPLLPKLSAPFPFSSTPRRDSGSIPLKKRKRTGCKSTKQNAEARHSKKHTQKKAPDPSSPRT